jgi:cyanophycinase
MSRGPLALVGSGEFTGVMEDVDKFLLKDRAQRAVFLPTAAAQEGAARLQYWVDLGNAHFRKMDVEPRALMVLDRAGAEDPAMAEQVAGAGMIYLSGGDPSFLATTLHRSLVGEAIRDAWETGAAVAGCSAGAMALAERVPRVRDPAAGAVDGLGLVPGVVVVPHFDRIDHWMPGTTELAVSSAPTGTVVLGIDEETAVVGGPTEWTVWGERSAWLMRAGEERHEFKAGTRLSTSGGAAPA